MNRTIKDATVKRFHYASHDQLRQHLADFVAAYNFGRRLKTLKGLTPYEFTCQCWTKEPGRFTLNPLHQMPGLNSRVRRAAGGTRGRAAQPRRRLSGAEGAGLSAEEKTLRAAERDRDDVAEARAAWRAELAGIDPGRLVFLDETGIDTRMARSHARAERGRRAPGQVPWGRRERLTVIGALPSPSTAWWPA